MKNEIESTTQDYDDGMMFFHSHGQWEAMRKLEKFYECKIYGVLDIDEVRDNLGYYECDFDVDNLPKQLLIDAIDYAYDKIDSCNDGYEQYLDCIHDYLQEIHSGKTTS